MNYLKTISCIILLTMSVNLSQAQTSDNNTTAIQEVVDKFKKAISEKDKEGFVKLFVGEPISWVGAGKMGQMFGTPEGFMDMLGASNEAEREDFHNVKIWNDELIGVVTFDYGFFINDKLSNWGKESWMLINDKGEWKITSVNFSMIMPQEKEYPF